MQFLDFLTWKFIFRHLHVVVFTESALRQIQSISRDVRMFVSLSVRHTLETTLPEGLETSGRRAYR